MAVLKNRAKMSTSTTGTGTITLGSAEDGYQTFADAGVADADVVRYVIEDGSNFEIGTGTYTSSGTTLSRTVSESSNSDAAINLSGSATVFIGATAEDIPALYAENYDGTSTKPSATGTNAVAIGKNAIASNTESVALGGDTLSSGYKSFAAAIGNSYFTYGAKGFASVAIGLQSKANQTATVAIGQDSQATNSNAAALGFNSVASGSGSLALGNVSRSSGAQSISLGDSYASGTDSFAAAIANNTSSYGSTGTNSISIGKLAKASGAYSTAIGESTQATASNSVCLGYYSQSTGQGSVTLGYDARATGVQSTAIGLATRNAINGSLKFAGGKHQASGDAQAGLYPLMAETTDATQTTMVTYHNNSATASTNNQIIANADTAVSFIGTVVGKQSGSANVAAWKIEGVIVNNGGTTTLVNSAITVLDNTPSWALALSADDTNDALSVKVTGAASQSVRWLANIQTAEVKYA
jgi:hypothetical protein